jgi:hypothetical protein
MGEKKGKRKMENGMEVEGQLTGRKRAGRRLLGQIGPSSLILRHA